MKRLAPSDSKSTHQEPKEAKEPRKSYAKVVESKPRPRTPPKRVTPSPPSSPKGGGKEWSRDSLKRPQTWCFVCEKAQRNSLQDHRTCEYWLKAQKAKEERGNSPQKSRPTSPTKKSALVCLNCQLAGRPSNQNYKECVEWQKFQETKRKLFSQGSNVESPKKVVGAKPETKFKGKVPDSKKPHAQ